MAAPEILNFFQFLLGAKPLEARGEAASILYNTKIFHVLTTTNPIKNSSYFISMFITQIFDIFINYYKLCHYVLLGLLIILSNLTEPPYRVK